MGTVNVTVRFNEEELRRLDELAQRMGKTRSDVIRDLIGKFDETLRQEVEKERKKWMMIGFVGALKSVILDPEVILRFVRRNVDVLGYPDFIIGMVRVRNRVVLFSHHDRTGSQLLQLIRSRIEDEVRREEAEIEQEGGEDGEVGVGKATPMHVRIRGPTRPGAPHATPASTKYKLVITNRAAPPIARPIVVNTVGKLVVGNGGGGTKVAVNAAVPKKQKSADTGSPINKDPVSSQARGSKPQANTNAGGVDLAGPNGQAPTDRLAGDFAFSLVANLYHKHRDGLLKLIEGVAGD